jgi:hypothetical protein
MPRKVPGIVVTSNREGEVVARFEPSASPESAEVTDPIEKALAEK